MERLALNVLCERILGSRDIASIFSHDAGDERRLGEALLLDQQFEGPVAPTACGYFEHAGLGAVRVDDRPDTEALQEGTPRDVLGQFLDRNAGLDASNVRLAEDELVERNVPGAAQDDFLGG